ncbi:MAG TPA: acetyl-CoA decarbonylase/synthase complex subunit delta [Methanomassiliicoccales archaeon]|nr:acetyl-CoA decarbonylase/synthase complex subunit delta [Methanomassiliicoccales archaeon]
MVEVPIPKEKWTGKIGSVTLGATHEKGGTRSKQLLVGGEGGMPFLSYESLMHNRPLIAGEVIDKPTDLQPQVLEELGEAAKDPVAWAKKWVEENHADLVCLKLHSTNPEEENRSPEEAARTVRAILDAVPVPLIVYGSGHEEKDAKVMEAVSNVGPKERLLLGHAEESAYKSISAAAMSNYQAIISFSNLDINLAKQINILLTDFGVKKEQIVTDPLMASLGTGLEYTYSVMERIRLAALMGDGMLQVPLLCDTSSAWKAKEASEDIEGHDGLKERAIWWEATTGLAALLAGADILIVRSPSAAKILRAGIDELLGGV